MKIKKQIAFLVLIFMFQLSAYAQSKTETVYIKVYEALGTALQGSQIIIIDSDNVTRTTSLKRIKNKEDITENMLEVKLEIDMWIKLGYKVISFSNGGSDNIWITNIILKLEK